MRKLLAAKPFLKRWSGNRFFLALHRLAGGDDAVASLAQVLFNLSYRRKDGGERGASPHCVHGARFA